MVNYAMVDVKRRPAMLETNHGQSKWRCVSYVSASTKVQSFAVRSPLLYLPPPLFIIIMAGKKRRGQKTPNFSTTNPAVNNARAKKLESYEDTLEPGSTDERESPSCR
jgi:hypothetical protein